MTQPPSPLTMLLSRHTRRREFITLLGGAAAAWPLAARAQQAERMRRIGVLMALAADDPESQARARGVPAGAAAIGLDRSAATCGSTTRWAAGDADRIRRYAAELVALAPDVILATGSAERGGRCSRRRRTVPIVFATCHRSGRRRLRREPGAAGRQRHRLHHVRIRHQREMAGAAQGDRARHDARGGPSGSRHSPPVSASSPRSRPWRRRSGWR